MPGMLLETKSIPTKFQDKSTSAVSHVIRPVLENPSSTIMAKSLPPSSSAHSRDTTARRPPMASSSASSRKRLQVRQPPRLKEPPWQPCRKCGKSYVQLPMELCNECDKKLYCTAPPPQKIRLDGKRPSLEAEPLVFPPAPAAAPASATTTPLLQKLNRNSTKLEKRGKKETRNLLPSIESVVGTPPVVAKQACSKTTGSNNGQRHFSDSAVGQFNVNEAEEGVVGDVPRPQILSSPRPSIRRKPVATHVKEDGEPVYELPAEVTLAPAERGRSTEIRDSRPLQVLQQAQQRQRRLSSAPPAPVPVPAPAESSPPRSTPPAPPSPPSPGPPLPQTYLLAQPTRDPQASFAQRVVRDAGGPLNAERQRVLAQELGRARAELECSRRAVRNLNEEMARMSVRQYRADELRRLKEDNRRLQAQISSASATARVGVEVLEAQRRRRLGLGMGADRPPNHQQHQKRPDVELGTLLEKGEKNPESLTRVYGQLCGPCRGAVHEFIAS